MTKEPDPAERFIVKTDGLGKLYGDFAAVTELSLDVRRGEVFAFLGPNGAGKTTTIKMLMGILQPSSGTALIDGLDCFKERAVVKSRVGYLPDDPVFYDYLTGREIIRFAGEMHGLPDRRIDRRSRPLIEKFDLANALDEFAVNYSRGMKKKLGMILALLHDPALLILDEPTSGLDPMATRTLQGMIREWAVNGKSVFFSTHLLDQAEKLCDRVGILFRGKMKASGLLGELRENLAEGGSLEEVFFAVTSGEDAVTSGEDAVTSGEDAVTSGETHE